MSSQAVKISEYLGRYCKGAVGLLLNFQFPDSIVIYERLDDLANILFRNVSNRLRQFGLRVRHISSSDLDLKVADDFGSQVSLLLSENDIRHAVSSVTLLIQPQP